MMYQAGEILLNKYRIEALIGRGAFAEVYRVSHVTLRVPRALKVLRRDAPGLGSTEYGDYRGRFELEGKLGARLNSPTPHPHLVQVFDFHTEGGLLALEMEYAPGGSLADRLARLREAGQLMAVDEAVRIALDVARGLAALHSVDAVHRDLKPSNILFDSAGRAKLADLGLAQMPGGLTDRTRMGSQAPFHPGTPGYKSPEQEQTRGYLTPASDVYALGAVLFELLTGRLYRNQRPGTRARSLRPDVPAPLDDLLARMVAQDPVDRPWDGAEAARLVREWKEIQPRQRWLPVAVVTGLAVLALMIWALTRGPSPSRVTQAAPTLTVTLTQAPALATSTVAPSATLPPPSPTFTPTTTPLATTTTYQTVSLQAYSKREKIETTSTLLGLRPGETTTLSDQDIPFQLGWTASTNCSTLPQDPDSFRVGVEVHKPTHIYVLIQAGVAAKNYDNKEVGRIRAIFSDGSEVVRILILGRNIRDWARTNPNVVSTISGDDIQPVWEGQTAQSAQGGIDMLTIELPIDKQSLDLTGIMIEDTSATTVGSVDPCIHILGITVRYWK